MITRLMPIGIEPRYIWDFRRIDNLKEAIKRYLDNGKSIPSEWITEYNEFVTVARNG